MALHIPDGLTRESINFPPLESQMDSHPPGVKRTLYLVTKSSIVLAAELVGLGGSAGSDITEGEKMGGEETIVVGRF